MTLKENLEFLRWIEETKGYKGCENCIYWINNECSNDEANADIVCNGWENSDNQ